MVFFGGNCTERVFSSFVLLERRRDYLSTVEDLKLHACSEKDIPLCIASFQPHSHNAEPRQLDRNVAHWFRTMKNCCLAT